jgi:ABC-type nitrate/sulfonate/bicarbonate transport system substrate-binding protein
MMRTRALISVLAALALAGCASGGTPTATSVSSTPLAPGALKHPAHVTLILDFVPNAVHAGIYRAIAAGYYKRQNIDLKVIPPPSTSAPLALINAGRADFALADGSDVAAQIAQGKDAEAIMAIAQRPLGGVIALASEHLTSPRDLDGRTVGITGVPSDTAVLDTTVQSAGGDPSKVHVVTVGFNGAQDLVAGTINAFTGFWPADGVQLAVDGHPITTFKLDDYGGPAYPGLVAFTTQKMITGDPMLVRAFVTATVHGYQDTIRDPGPSVNDLIRLNPTIKRNLAQASLHAYLPLFNDGGRVPFGTLQPRNEAALSRWMVAHKLIAKPIRPQRYGTSYFLPSSR